MGETMAAMKVGHLAGWMAGQLVERLVEGTAWKMVEHLVDSKG
jgi:uncharacterized membrane protein YeaQ/YmgE (transglycosylase-associated protein family)